MEKSFVMYRLKCISFQRFYLNFNKYMIKNSNILNVHKNTEFSIFKINIFRVLYSVSLQLRGVNAVSKEYVYYIVQI